MNSKLKIASLVTLLAVAITAALFAGCSKSGNAPEASKSKTLYTCGMHPQVVQDHPGNCPICGMKLTPIHEHAGTTGTNAAANTSALAIDPVTIQNMNIRTTPVKRGPLRRVIRTVGTIDYNETALADVTTKFKGWIEKLNVDATGQLVHRGEPLFSIYSPELYSAEIEYLLSLNQGSSSNASSAALRETAANKLKFYDISAAQIAELEKTREPRKTLQVTAPADGFVIKKMVVEGQMVDAGMELYQLADLGIVWVYAQIYEQDLPFIRLGQEAVVRLSSMPDREFRGRVTYVYPSVDEKTRTARVRMEFENPGYFLKPGMFVSVQVISEIDPSVLLVPDSAVLRSGEKNTVFVALPGGKFDPRTVVLGPQAEGDRYQVISGLSEGEPVVTSGQFMLDSESQLREAIQKMRSPTEATPMDGTNATVATNAAPARSESEGVVYVCPMPAHVSITYDHPGKCPICGMSLVPVTPRELKRLQPGGKVLYYTCPMPEHASVHEEKPGKCPICGMTLIPVMGSPDSKTEAQPPAGALENDSLHNPSLHSAPSQPASKTQLPSAANSARETLYTCPMHLEVVTNRPGKCPECEMDLVPTSTFPNGKIAEEHWRKEHATEHQR